MNFPRAAYPTDIFGDRRLAVMDSDSNDVTGVVEMHEKTGGSWSGTRLYKINQPPSATYFISCCWLGPFLACVDLSQSRWGITWCGGSSGDRTAINVYSDAPSTRIYKRWGQYNGTMVVCRADECIQWTYFTTSVASTSTSQPYSVTLSGASASALSAYRSSGRKIIIGGDASPYTWSLEADGTGSDQTIGLTSAPPSFTSGMQAIVLPTNAETLATGSSSGIHHMITGAGTWDDSASVYGNIGVTSDNVHMLDASAGYYELDRPDSGDWTATLRQASATTTTGFRPSTCAIDGSGEPIVFNNNGGSSSGNQTSRYEYVDAGNDVFTSTWVAGSSAMWWGAVSGAGGSAGGDPEVTTIHGHMYMMPVDSLSYRALDTGTLPDGSRMVINASMKLDAQGSASYHHHVGVWVTHRGWTVWTYADDGAVTLAREDVTGTAKKLTNGHFSVTAKLGKLGTCVVSSAAARGLSLTIGKRDPATLARLQGYLVEENPSNQRVADATSLSLLPWRS